MLLALEKKKKKKGQTMTPSQKVLKGMSPVRIQLKISCGCGFQADNVGQAKMHAEETKHVLTCHGVVGLPERLGKVRVV